MNCPSCGSLLKEHQTRKSALFLVCSKWPKCKVSGTPELFERLQKPTERPEPIRLGAFVTGVAQLAIHHSRLKAAKTAEERERVRKQALEAIR